LKDKLTELNIKDIIILGDVNNNRNEISVTTLHILPVFFKVLKEFNIIITVGNHDCFYNNRSDVHSIGTLSRWDNITVIDKPTTVTMFNKVLTFCPWGTRLDQIPTSDIIFGHFEIQSFKMTYSMICETGFNPKDLLEKSSLILSGHFHITENRKYKEGNILYLGCPYELNWGDYTSTKGIYLLDIPDKTVEFVENNISPRHKKINLSELLLSGLTDNIKNDFKGNIVKLSIDKPIEIGVIEKLVEKLNLLKPFDLKLEHYQEDGTITNTGDLSKFENVDVEGSLIEYVNQMEGIDYKEDVTKYILDVYSKMKAKVQEVVVDEE
jgi:hypothetical protein